MRFDNAEAWWNGMNRNTRRDLIKQFGFRSRDDWSYDKLRDYEKKTVAQRFAHYKATCERLKQVELLLPND